MGHYFFDTQWDITNIRTRMWGTGCTGTGHSLVYASKRVSKPSVKVYLS